MELTNAIAELPVLRLARSQQADCSSGEFPDRIGRKLQAVRHALPVGAACQRTRIFIGAGDAVCAK